MKEDIIRMAAEVWTTGSFYPIPSSDDVERFFHAAYAAGAAAEREACAKVCDVGVDTEHPTVKGHIMKNFGASPTLAAAIRARGNDAA